MLVVFAILVAPAALASRYFKAMRPQLILAWIVGSLGLIASFVMSYNLDLPSGATIVCMLTSFFFLALLIRGSKFKPLGAKNA